MTTTKSVMALWLIVILASVNGYAQFKLILQDPLTSGKKIEGESMKQSTKGSFTRQGWRALEQGGQLLIELEEAKGFEGALKVDVTNLDWEGANLSAGHNTKMHFINMFSNPSGDHHFEDEGTGGNDALWTLRGGAGGPGEGVRYGNNFKILYASRGAKRAAGSDYHEVTSPAPDDWVWHKDSTYTFHIVWSKHRRKWTVSVNHHLFYEEHWENQVEPLKYVFLGSAGDYETFQGPYFSNLRVYQAPVETKMVEKWDVFEEVVVNHKQYDNRFEDVELEVTYTKPDGTEVDFWGFHTTHDRWHFRFMPDQVGTWQYEAKFSDGAPGKSGKFEVVPSSIPGLIGKDETNPKWFGYKGGKHELIRSFHVGDRFFANQSNSVTGEKWSKARRKEFLDWIQEHDYNMLSIASFYLNRNVESRGLGWDTPDLWNHENQLPDAIEYDKMEEILDDLKARRLIIYPFAGFFGKEADFPDDPEKRELYLKYTIARFGAYWNQLFLVGGPEPLYKKNPHLTKEEVLTLGNLIDSLDIFDHLLSVHSPTGDNPFNDESWVSYTIMQGPKTLDRKKLSDGLLRNHHPDKPLYAQETLWPGNIYGHKNYGVEGIRKNGYVLHMSAAAINFADMNGNSSSGFSGKLDFDQMHPEYHEAMSRVWDFFEVIPFYEMSPRQDLTDNGYLLAREGEQYLLYLEEQGNATIKTTGNGYYGLWINAQSPADNRETGMITSTSQMSSPESGDDWLLYLHKDEKVLNNIKAKLADQDYALSETMVLKAIEDFEHRLEGYSPMYKDEGGRKDYLAIDPMKYQDQWAGAKTTYQGDEGLFDLTLITYKEYDGASKYRLKVNGEPISTFQNPGIASKSGEGDYRYTFERVNLKPGDEIIIEAQAQSNKEVPEEGAPGGYGWSRGRWKSLEIR